MFNLETNEIKREICVLERGARIHREKSDEEREADREERYVGLSVVRKRTLKEIMSRIRYDMRGRDE